MSALKYWDTGSSTWKVVAGVAAGLPVGGTAAQVLSKIDATDYNTQWTTLAGGGNVSNVATPVNDQIGIWTGATTLEGDANLTFSGGATGVLKLGGTDVGLARNAAGVFEINNGTAGTYRDLILRMLTFNGSGARAIELQSSTDDLLVRNNTANTMTRLRVLPRGTVTTTPATLELYGTDYIADAGNYERFLIVTRGSADTYHQIKCDGLGTGARRPISINADGSATQIVCSTTGPVTVGGTDAGFARNAANVLEINNGTAGTYADLKARTVNVTTDIQVNGTSTGIDYINASTATQTPAAVDVYVTGSSVVVPAGAFKAKGQYHCVFDVTKSAGTGAIVIILRVGTAASTGDAARITWTFAAGTGVADSGTFDVYATWRTVGSGTSAVITGYVRAQHNLATTGLISDGTNKTIVGPTSSGFDSSTATTIGVSFNGSTAFAGSIACVQAQYVQ